MQPRATSHDNCCSQRSFLLLIFFGPILVSGVPATGLASRREGAPLPLDLWNHRVRRKSQIKSWRSITCGQNLDVKELSVRAPGINSRNGRDALSAHRHGLDDDRKIAGLCARSDVTCACGKAWNWPTQAKIRLEWATYWNGLMIRTPSISRAACMSSEKSTLHPACLAERTINASQKFMP